MHLEREYGYDSLAANIVIEAAKDYRKALKKLKKDPEDFSAGVMKCECESFFRSVWYHTICTVDPKILVEKLRKEAGYDGTQQS